MRPFGPSDGAKAEGGHLGPAKISSTPERGRARVEDSSRPGDTNQRGAPAGAIRTWRSALVKDGAERYWDRTWCNEAAIYVGETERKYIYNILKREKG